MDTYIEMTHWSGLQRKMFIVSVAVHRIFCIIYVDGHSGVCHTLSSNLHEQIEIEMECAIRKVVKY